MTATLEQFLADFKVYSDIPLQWGEMDAFQHINNVNYFRYFETARILQFGKTGLMKSMGEKGIGPILASTECKYRRALVYPDTIKVGVKTTEFEEFGFIHEYAIDSEQQDAMTTFGQARIVLVNYKTQQKERMTDEIIEELKRLNP